MISSALLLACVACGDRIDSWLAEHAMIQSSISRLASPRFQEREAASRELVAFGERAIDPLKVRLRTTDDLEVERRLEVLVGKLERQRLIEPRRVSFTGTQTMPELLKIIQRQSGYQLNLQRERGGQKTKFTVNWDRTPFWQALDEVCDAAGLSVEPYGGDQTGMGLQIYDNESVNPYIWRSGPFRAVAINIGLNRQVQLNGLARPEGIPARSESLNFNIQVFTEPKSPMISTPTVRVVKALDDRGTDLVPVEEERYRSYYYNPEQGMRTHSSHLWVNLGRAHRDATIIKELNAKVTFTLLLRTRPLLTIDNLTKSLNKSYTCRGAELKVLSVNPPNGDRFSMRVAFKDLSPPQQNESQSNGVIPQRLEVADERNQPYRLINAEYVNTAADDGATVELVFAIPEGESRRTPTKLTFVEWVGNKVETEVAFRNIPLP